jgi:hypothetical protein
MRSILPVAAAALAAFAAQADPRPVVVELFTSQGCSSCPPADRVLAELAARPGVLALGFHVDYWDRLGWKDPFSTPGATARQNEYAALLGRREVYTPQMVIDGTSELVGSHRDAALTAIGEARPVASAPVGFAADRSSVEIGAGEGSGRVLLVRFATSRSTPVATGENAGHTALDVDAVETLTSLGDWSGAARTFAIAPPGENEGIAILVQGRDGKMLGAAALR